MPDRDTTAKFKADISQLKAAMQQAQRQVRLVTSEFKAATAGMDDWTKSEEGLTAKLKQLNGVLDAQKKKLALMNEELAKTEAVHGKTSAEADKVRIAINNQQAAIAKTEKEIESYNKQLEELPETLDDVGDAADKASDGFTVFKAALADMVADGIKMAISAMKDLAAEALQTGIEFESAMSKVGAVSGASAEEMQQLTEKAKEMGESTKFSATESAEAFNYMAMAGWKTEEMLDGIEGVMNLAAASGSDLATTSDIVTDALTAMGYQAKDAGRLADVMAAASSNANTNVEMMGSTFQYAAPLIGALGMSMEDTAVAIGLMANAGIKGDKAGTALRSTLNRLSAPPKQCADEMERLGLSLTDSEGNMKSLNTVMTELRTAFKGLSETEATAAAKHIAGAEAMSGLLAIVNASDEDFQKLTVAVNESAGAAKEMADEMNDNVGGQLTLLQSKIQGIMIKLFTKGSDSMKRGIRTVGEALDLIDWDKVGDAIGNFAEKAANAFEYIIKNGNTIIKITKNIGAVIATAFVVNKIGAFAGMISSLTTAYGTLNGVLTLVKGTQLALNAAQLASPIGLLIAGVTALGAAYLYSSTKAKEEAEAEFGLTQEQKALNQSIHENYEAQKQLIEARNESVESVTGEFNYINKLKDEYNSLIDSNGNVKEGYQDRANFILNELSQALGVELDNLQQEIEQNGKLGQSIDELIQKKQAEATLSAYDDSYRQAKSNETKALQEAVTAQNNYTDSKQKYDELQAKINQTEKERDEALINGIDNTYAYQNQLTQLEREMGVAKNTMEDNKKALEEANKAYSDGQTTIQNYEGLSAAIIDNDTQKIKNSLSNLTSGFKDATSATEQELNQQVKDAEDHYKEMQQAYLNGSEVVTEEAVRGAKELVDKAKAELDKLPPASKESAATAVDEYNSELVNGQSGAEEAGRGLKDSVYRGTEDPETEKTGKQAAEKYNKGIEGELPEVNKTGAKMPTEAKNGADSNKADFESSGKNAVQGFITGMASLLQAVWDKGAEIANAALGGMKNKGKEGSPWLTTIQSGKWFGEGFEDGITASKTAVSKAAGNIALSALTTLKKTQKEGSPSELTYQSGKMFTQGFINGISSLEKTLVSTTKSLVNNALSELLKLKDFNFSEVTENASNAFSSGMQEQVEYMINRINYQNQQQLKDFDNTMKSLQDASAAEVEKAQNESEKKQEKLQKKIEKKQEKSQSKSTKKQIKKLQKKIKAEQEALKNTTEQIQDTYDTQIQKQQEMKEAYQQASSSMISEFTKAVQEYQTAAQKLIDDTMNAISSDYQSQYDALISKQDNLIQKLKAAGDLFNVSGAGVMTINDLQAQTQAIKEYAARLQKIKNKVSSELFDEIAQFDMKEGNAYMDRLLAMSDAELQAYNNAFTEKMRAAETLSEDLYASDFDTIANNYEKAMKSAFAGLPKQLEELGYQTMQGFLSGLTKNTAYMEESVKTFISGMVDTFKKQLGIASPSKVTMALGELTGEGFADGILKMVKTVQEAAKDITDAVTDSLDMADTVSSAKMAISAASGATGYNRNAGSFVGDRTQIINFNQVNNSPKSLDRLSIYRQTNNMLFSAKVGLSNV